MGKRIDSKKMIRNTGMLYTRQILILVINLISVRLLLQNFGEEDYGLYTLVAGIAAMFSVLSGAMSSASQRFFSYYMGQDKYEDLKKCVWTSLVVYGLIAIIVIAVAETGGLWYVHHRLAVPEYRYDQVVLLYHFSVLSLMITIFTSPLTAYVLSCEDMNIYAMISVIEVVLKLFIAVFLAVVDEKIRLGCYGGLLAGVSFFSFLLYFLVVKIKYKWKLEIKFEKKLFREMMSFASWNLFGSTIFTFKNQAVNVVINQAFHPVVVTARGIATSVYSALVSFSTNFGNALRPQIIKSYAADEKGQLYRFVFFSSKITFLLMLFFMFPFWYDMTFVLEIWLKTVPEYTVEFARLGLWEALIDSLTLPIQPLADATGNIKRYQLIVGGILLLNFPLSFVLIKIVKNPVVVYYVAIGLTIASSYARVLCTAKISELAAADYLKEVALKAFILCGLLFGSVFWLDQFLQDAVLRHVCVYSVYAFAGASLSWGFLLNAEERMIVKGIVRKWRYGHEG